MSSNYALLDEPAQWSAFSTPSPENKNADQTRGLWQSQVVVEGMHCGSCALNVEKALRSVPGVKQATVNGATHRAEVVWSAEQVKPSQWLNALHNAGYEAVPANDHVARNEGKWEVRRQLWRWAVAGFCMMQVMMYALPPYVSTDITMEMLSLLRWAAWVLTLPVMFFSADVFTAAAWRDLKRGDTKVVKSDDIAHGLIDQASHYKADLIVMASHGRKGIKRLLLGSETLAVLTHVKIPVLVLR
jgi:Cu2+-exporting ATPase